MCKFWIPPFNIFVSFFDCVFLRQYFLFHLIYRNTNKKEFPPHKLILVWELRLYERLFLFLLSEHSSLHLILYGACRLIIRLKNRVDGISHGLFWRKQNIKRLFKTFLFLCGCDAKFSFKWMKWLEDLNQRTNLI